jgi:hypothetical protein
MSEPDQSWFAAFTEITESTFSMDAVAPRVEFIIFAKRQCVKTASRSLEDPLAFFGKCSNENLCWSFIVFVCTMTALTLVVGSASATPGVQVTL